MQALADMVHDDPIAARSVLGDRQLRVSDGVTKGMYPLLPVIIGPYAQQESQLLQIIVSRAAI